MLVLIADDDQVSRQMLTGVLRKSGYDTLDVADGLTALQCLQRENPPRLAILDWMMPGMDGVDVCRQIRTQASEHYTYVLLATARSDRSDLLTGLEAGADDYLIKPFDIAELKARLAVGRRIVQMQEQLRQAQGIEALGLLTGGIAHDFNNVVMIINSYCETLLDSVQDAKVRHKLEQIQKAGYRAAGYTSQLLAFSRQQVISPVVLDLNAVVTRTIEQFQHTPQRGIRFDLDLARDLWSTFADPSQIERILLALISNAREAIGDHGRITISTCNTELDEGFVHRNAGARPGHYVALSVSDTGCGMPPDVQAHIFDPFFTTKNKKGQMSGMGLAVTYGMVKQNRGYITVNSVPDQGTTVTVHLPKCDSLPEPSDSFAAEAKTTGRSRTVLVVDDEASTRENVCDYLRERGYRVLAAADAREALGLCTGPDLPGVVVTDVIMTGMNGWELARRLLDVYPDMQVIFMTGFAGTERERDPELISRFRLLQKPFQLSSLVEAIEATKDANKLL